ncbi:hypothetical protein BJ912DRAFT_1042357 [Pholiota molesta]|nr:hypothetical protein BJ912DRAFT_1042357 [Pholiota molesta]
MCSRSHTMYCSATTFYIILSAGSVLPTILMLPPLLNDSAQQQLSFVKLGSVLTGTLNRVAQFKQLRTKIKTDSEPFFGNKAAESCYWYIKETLNCEDTHQLAMAHETHRYRTSSFKFWRPKKLLIPSSKR